MKNFDTHCHLDHPLFADITTLLSCCATAGICCFAVPGVEPGNWTDLLNLAQNHPSITAAPGIHPLYVAGAESDTLQTLDALLQRPEVTAVGEIGLDFYHGYADEAAQRSLFTAQLALARNHRLPVLLHVRRAHDQVLALLRRAGLSSGGIVHAFSGSRQQAEQYADLGFYLGIGGSITWPRAKKLRRLAADMPLSQLVLETDAPDMPLCGYQGEANHPLRLVEVLETLAELREEGVESVAEVCWKNSCAVFRKRAIEEVKRKN